MASFSVRTVPILLISLCCAATVGLAAESSLEAEGRMRADTGGLGAALAVRDDDGWRFGAGIDGDGFSLYRPRERPEPVTRNWELFADYRAGAAGSWSYALGASGFLQTLSFSDPPRSYLSTFVTAGVAPRLSGRWEISPLFAVFALYAPRIFYSSHATDSLEEEFELDVYPVRLAPHLFFMWAGPVYLGARVSFGVP